MEFRSFDSSGSRQGTVLLPSSLPCRVPPLTASFANPATPSSSSLASLESLSLSVPVSIFLPQTSASFPFSIIISLHLVSSFSRASFFLLIQQHRRIAGLFVQRSDFLFLSRKLHRSVALPSLEELSFSLFFFLSLKLLPSFSFECLTERETRNASPLSLFLLRLLILVSPAYQPHYFRI